MNMCVLVVAMAIILHYETEYDCDMYTLHVASLNNRVSICLVLTCPLSQFCFFFLPPLWQA